MTIAVTDLVELPAELSAKAREVPGLPERLLRFIRLEVEMNERRRHHYSPQAVELVARARMIAGKRKSDGTGRSAAMRDFHANYSDILNEL